jgi:hypothetical protein
MLFYKLWLLVIVLNLLATVLRDIADALSKMLN